MHNFCNILTGLLCFRCLLVFGALDIGLNLTDFLHHRQRRTLTFEGGGIIKLAIGPILPFELGDAANFRSALSFYNLQGGDYRIATSPLYPWDKWEDTIARSMQRPGGNPLAESVDDSRLLIYTALERYMSSADVDGRECLRRAICENAQTDQHVGLLAELMNILLTPGMEKDLDPIYNAAYVAGKRGADCLKLHRKCPHGSSWLDQYMDSL